jgi:hypothetical protein
MHSRGGRWSEVLFPRSEDVLSITSFITSELTKHGVREFVYFLYAKVLADICGSSAISLRTFVFVVVLGTPLRKLCLLTLILFPLMRRNWLFFLVMSLIIHITVWFVTIRYISIRIWVKYLFNNTVFAPPPLRPMSEHIYCGSTGRRFTHITSAYHSYKKIKIDTFIMTINKRETNIFGSSFNKTQHNTHTQTHTHTDTHTHTHTHTHKIQILSSIIHHPFAATKAPHNEPKKLGTAVATQKKTECKPTALPKTQQPLPSHSKT